MPVNRRRIIATAGLRGEYAFEAGPAMKQIFVSETVAFFI